MQFLVFGSISPAHSPSQSLSCCKAIYPLVYEEHHAQCQYDGVIQHLLENVYVNEASLMYPRYHSEGLPLKILLETCWC